MSDRLFDKIWKVTAWRETVPPSAKQFSTKQLRPGEQLEITDVRVKFKVERSFTKHPNACDIEIFNLEREESRDLETLPLKVQLEAGYDGNSRLMYIGDLRFGMTKQDGGQNNVTLLQLGDGDRSLARTRVSRSYAPGTTYRTILADVARAMGMQLPENLATDPALDRQFVSGSVAHGPARDMLSNLLAPFGYHWSVQNGALRALQDHEVVNGGLTAIPVDREHGMLGSPQFGTPPKSGKPPHMTVDMLLYPELLPGDLVQLTSLTKNGLFRIDRVTHTGDSHAEGTGSWTTTIEIKPY